MKHVVGTLLLIVLSAGAARSLDFEDFVGRYDGTMQIEQRVDSGTYRFQGYATLRIRDERMILRGSVRSGSAEARIDFEVDLDEDDDESEADELHAKPVFPFIVTNPSPFRWGVVGDRNFLVIREARVTKVKGGYSLSSGSLARRDGSRARGHFSLERRGEEVTLVYLFIPENGERLQMTVNVDR